MKEKIRKISEELERIRDEEGNPFWNLGKDACEFLQVLVRTLDAKNVLEIGTSNGLSGLNFAEALRSTGGHLYTVDSHDERSEMARKNFEEAGVTDLITQIKGHAPEAISSFFEGKANPEFDLVLMDATKQEAIEHFEAILPLCKKKCVIVTDNIYSHSEELRDYLEFMKNRSHIQNVELDIGTGMLVSVMK